VTVAKGTVFRDLADCELGEVQGGLLFLPLFAAGFAVGFSGSFGAGGIAALGTVAAPSGAAAVAALQDSRE